MSFGRWRDDLNEGGGLMSYLQFDLDAKRRCRFIANATGVAVERIAWGLLELWEHCWREKQTKVSLLMLSGFFGPQADVLVPHFLEHEFLGQDGHAYTVRGAQKRLGIAEKQSEGGRRNVKNLRRGPGSTRRPPGDHPEGEPETTRSLSPALTARSQQPTASSKNTAAEKPAAAQDVDKPKGKDRSSDPRHAPLVAKLTEIGRSHDPGWQFGGKADAAVLVTLLSRHAPDEIEARWRRAWAISAGGFPTVRSLPELLKFWNHLGPAPPGKRDTNALFEDYVKEDTGRATG